MAAGRQNFSRRGQETSSCGSRFDHRTSDHRRNGSIDGGGCRFVYRFEHELQEGKRKKEVNVSANGSIFGSIKKRKFSPVVWDRVEKQVKISSKNRVHTTSSVITRSLPPNSLRDCGSIERCLVPAGSDCQVYSVDSFVSNVSDDVGTPSSLATRTPKEHDQEIKNEDGEYVGVRNLSKSKWAFEDSPRFKSNDSNASPESGEIKQEAFGTSGESSSLSTEDEHDSKNVDDRADSASSGYLSSESGHNDHETSSRIGLGIRPSCRNVFEFERLGKISEGTYGVVHKARDKKTGDIVALKKVKVGKDSEGFPVTALREINILGGLQHPSLVEMNEVVTDDFDGVYMVMEYVDHELKGYLEGMRQPFSQSEVKRLMLQLLEGVSYLHDNYVMHRDLKTSNLLLNDNGELKICDFGLSRQYASPLKPYTPLVVTLWYRAPELLGMKNYSTAVDMWSIGCIMAELLSKKPLFDGNTELEQINKIFRTLGTPDELSWPGYSKLPGVKPNFVKQPTNALRKKFPVAVFTGSPTLTELGFDLLNRFLTYDPEKRITAKEALDHGWFQFFSLSCVAGGSCALTSCEINMETKFC